MDHKLIYLPTFPQRLVAHRRIFFLIINLLTLYYVNHEVHFAFRSAYISKTAKMLTLPNDASIEETTGCIWRPSIVMNFSLCNFAGYKNCGGGESKIS